MEQAVPARLHPGCKTNEGKRKPFLGVAYGLREVTLASKGALATRAHPVAPLIESVPGAIKNGFVCKTPCAQLGDAPCDDLAEPPAQTDINHKATVGSHAAFQKPHRFLAGARYGNAKPPSGARCYPVFRRTRSAFLSAVGGLPTAAFFGFGRG
jgi:hypothetical protein